MKNPGGDGKEKRRRSKNHNKNIGMTQSFNAIWRALIDEGDTAKAEAALAKAKKKYAVEVLAAVYADRLEAAGGKRERAGVWAVFRRERYLIVISGFIRKALKCI